jgi:hypothetical protein
MALGNSVARLFGGKQFAEQEAGAEKLNVAVAALSARVGELVGFYNAAAAAGKRWLAGDFLESLARTKGDLAKTEAELAKAGEGVQQLANAIGQKLGQAVRDTFQSTLAKGLGILGQLQGLLTRTAALANPAGYQQLQRAFNDLGAVIGQVLAPVFREFTQLVRGTADFIINLDPGVKKLAAGVGALALAFGVGSKAVTLLGSVAGPAFALVETAMAALIGEATLFDVAFAGLPLIVGALVTGLGALGLAASQNDAVAGALSKTWEQVKATFAPVGAMISALMDDLAPLGQAMGAVFQGVIEGILQKIQEMVRQTAAMFALVETGLSRLRHLDFSGGFGDEVAQRFKDLTDSGEKKPKKSSVGAAPVAVQSTTLESIGEQARQSAFSVGAANQDYDRQLVDQAAKAEGQRDRMVSYLERIAGASDTTSVAASATREVLNGIVSVLNPMAGLAMRLKF